MNFLKPYQIQIMSYKVCYQKICEIEYWPKKSSEWDNVLSLFGEAKSQNKINNIRQESIKLFEILSDYM